MFSSESNKARGAKQVTTAPAREQISKSARAGATSQRNLVAASSGSIASWVYAHRAAFLIAWRQLWRNRVSALLTTLVIGIALALPTGLYLVMDNGRQFSEAWQGDNEFAVYLKASVNDKQAREFAVKLRDSEDVAAVVYISPTEAAQEFAEYSSYGDALRLLDDNPLPSTLIVTPQELNTYAADRLLQNLRAYPEVEVAKLDREWVEKFNTILALLNRLHTVVLCLLGFTIVIVVGNTIRLDIQNRSREIIVTKLVGGTDAFVRRPFLYGGFWYGVLGGIAALAIVALCGMALEGPMGRLLGLFDSGYQLLGLGLGQSIAIIATAFVFSWGGSWYAVGKHLQAIEPE